MSPAADYQWPSSKKVSPDCKDIVAKILVVDVSERITVAEIQVGSPGLLPPVNLSS